MKLDEIGIRDTTFCVLGYTLVFLVGRIPQIVLLTAVRFYLSFTILCTLRFFFADEKVICMAIFGVYHVLLCCSKMELMCL